MDIHSKKLKCSDKEEIRKYALSLGFEACGFAEAREVSPEARRQYSEWISGGKHFEMKYLEKYAEIRDNPVLLLDGAKSLICVALNYYPSQFQPREAPQFAYYAYGKDYHEVMKERLNQLSLYITEKYGAVSRACVDTAPLRERYWAQQAGIGYVARNNQLIIPGKGSYFFLGTLVTTLSIEPDDPCELSCCQCRRCIAYCPTHALSEDGALDARKCLSCLTIEYRGDLPDDISLAHRIYGCDTCQRACPHNQGAIATSIPEFLPSQEFLSLTRDSIATMTHEQFLQIFRNSAVRRAKLPMLLRNLAKMSR